MGQGRRSCSRTARADGPRRVERDGYTTPIGTGRRCARLHQNPAQAAGTRIRSGARLFLMMPLNDEMGPVRPITSAPHRENVTRWLTEVHRAVIEVLSSVSPSPIVSVPSELILRDLQASAPPLLFSPCRLPRRKRISRGRAVPPRPARSSRRDRTTNRPGRSWPARTGST